MSLRGNILSLWRSGDRCLSEDCICDAALETLLAPPVLSPTHTRNNLFRLLLEDNYFTSRDFYSKGTLLLTGKLPRSLLALGEFQGPGTREAVQECLTTMALFTGEIETALCVI